MVIAAIVVGIIVIAPLVQYNNALSLMEQGKYEDAIAIFEGLQQYKDSADMIKKCKEGIADRPYQEALKLLEQKKYRQAFDAFIALDGYKDSKDYTWGFFTLPEKTVYTNPDGTTVTKLFEYEFNDNGDLTKELRTTIDKNGKSKTTVAYERTYDANGNVQSIAAIDHNSETKYLYHYSDGKIVTMEEYDPSGTLLYSTTRYEYDQNGNMTKATTVYYDIDTGEEVSTVTQSIIYSHDGQVADTTKICDTNKDDGYTYQIFEEKMYFDRFHFMLAKDTKQYMYVLRGIYYS